MIEQKIKSLSCFTATSGKVKVTDLEFAIRVVQVRFCS